MQISFFSEKKIKKPDSIVISASRMTDMPKFYPDELIEEVEKRLEKGIKIHTLVLWSKHPKALISGNLYKYLNKLKEKKIQLFYQCTITGMGGRDIGGKQKFYLEPNVPKPYQAIKDLKGVINLIENPLRINLRIDPIVRLENKFTGEKFTNISLVEEIIRETAKLGIKNYTFSFLEKGIHKKVDNRFSKYEWNIKYISIDEKKKVYKWFKKKSEEYGVNVKACCVEGLEESRCIDGYILDKLKNSEDILSLKEPKKRKLCGCTDSIDIGGWPPKRCFSGCKYCYANAEIK